MAVPVYPLQGTVKVRIVVPAPKGPFEVSKPVHPDLYLNLLTLRQVWIGFEFDGLPVNLPFQYPAHP